MTEFPLVSILCLSYNQQRFLVESLESLKSQTYHNIEILICDDCSKDNSVEIINNWIKDHPQLNIRFIPHTRNQGICKSLNELLAVSKGKYLITIALDDLMEPDKIERHVAILENSSLRKRWYSQMLILSMTIQCVFKILLSLFSSISEY